uniref:HMG box domain-containing protein n=1 Tax=Heligmosomoides polygyrus TaxID=6339 RepID=A0A8L8JTX7_HELPZ
LYSGMSMRDIGKPPVRGKTSPYGFFVKMCYEEHKKKYPNENVQVTEISKKCSEKWKTMSDDEKRRFYELAQKDAERYQAEVGLWEYELAVLDVVLAFFGISHDFDVLGAFILCGVAAYGGEDAMRKRKRAKKDPNAPKRALSAFFFFSQDRRPEVQQMHPEWKVGQVTSALC